MGNTSSTTHLRLDGKEGHAAVRLGLAQHEDPEAPHSIGNQEQTVSVKPADSEFISHKQSSDSLVTSAINSIPSKALSSASPLVLSAREISASSRSSSLRTVCNDESSLTSTIRAHQSSGEGVSDQHTEDHQRISISSGGDNRAVGVNNHQDSCGQKGNGEKRLTKDGAWQQMLDSTTTVTWAGSLCDPIASNEFLHEEEDDEEEHFEQKCTRVHRDGHRGSHKVQVGANATRVRDEKDTSPVVNGLEKGKSSRRLANGEAVSITRRGARATVCRKHPVINMDRSDDGSIGSAWNRHAASKRVSSEVTRSRARERSSPVGNEEQPMDTASSLLRLPIGNESAEGEVLSVSSANSGIAQEDFTVSTSYLLPPVEVAGSGGGTDIIFEDSSIEDCAASVSLAPFSDKGDDVDARRGERGGPTSRHRGSSDAVLRIRSKGSLSLARIHEQDEGRKAQRPPNRRALRGLCSSKKDIESEGLDLQELSELDEEALEKGVAAAAAGVASTVTGAETSSIVSLPRVSSDVATPTLVDLGYQRAELELRNLMLEREVEQLKACLRSMGGNNFHFLQQNVQGCQQEGHTGGSAMGASSLNAFSRKEWSASNPATLRSVAPTARCHRDGGDVLYGSKRGKTIHVRELATLDHHRVEMESSAAGGSHETRSGEDAAGEDVMQTSSRASPRNCDDFLSDGRTSEKLQVSGGVPLTSTASRNFPACFSSPARHLRTTMAASSESTSEVEGKGFDAARVGEVAGGTHSFSTRGKNFKERTTSRSESINVAIRTQKDKKRRDSIIDSGLEHSSANLEAPSTLFVKKKPLPRLGVEETDRRRKVVEKSKTSKAPGYLMMGRRRSMGTMVSANLAPASSAEQTAVNALHGRSGGSSGRGAGRSRDNACPLPLQILAGHKHRHEAGSKGDATTSQPAERDERKCAPRRPARRVIVGSASSPAIADPMTTTEVSTAAAGTMTTTSLTSDIDEHAQGSPYLRESGVGKVGRQRPAKSGPALKNRAGKDGGSGVQTQTAATATATKMATNSTVVDAIDNVGTSKVRGLSSSAVASPKARVTAERREALPPPRVIQQEGRERWPATLDARWAEVEFVLCRRVDCKESFEYTAEATKESLLFIGKLEKKAQELGVLKGQLSRWLLPFNTNTSVEEQQAATPREFQDSLQASSTSSVINGVGVLSAEEARYLTDGARKVRQLVRLKIADDNDLNTAKDALITMAGFFDSLSEEAARRGGTVTAFDILQERRAISPISRPTPLPSIPRYTSTSAVATSAATYAVGASSTVSNSNNGCTVLPISSGGAGSHPTRKIESRPDFGGGSGSDGREVKRRNRGGSYPTSATTTTIGTSAVVSETATTPHTKEHVIDSVDYAVTGVDNKNSSSISGVEQTIAPLDRASTGLAAAASYQTTTSRVAAQDLEGETTIKNAAEKSAEIGGKYSESGETHDRSRGETTAVARAEPAADPTTTSSPHIDAEQTPRASGAAEVKGVAPPGSLE